MTNLEWIQSIDKRKLADFLCSLFDANGCNAKCPGYEYCSRGHRGLLDWLNMEADEYVE